MKKILCLLVTLILFSGVAIAAPLSPKDKLPAPAGFEKVSPCVPFMGSHYVQKDKWPFGPILGYDEKGKLVFFEYMIDQKDFVAGKSWEDLPGLTPKHTDHVEIGFNPKGHEGYEIPHYDLHFYVVSKAAQMKICPPKK